MTLKELIRDLGSQSNAEAAVVFEVVDDDNGIYEIALVDATTSDKIVITLTRSKNDTSKSS